MKKIFILFSGLLLSMLSYAQAPQGINYQGVARDAGGAAISKQNINVKFQIHSGSTSGTVVFTEIQSTATDTFGLYSLVIGASSALSSVNWSAGPMFLQIDIDPGTGYLTVANTQLMSVPYALYSGSSTTGVTVVTSSSPLNITNGSTTPNITINKASSSSSGYLDSTDWNTFNNKGNGTVTSITGGTGIDGGTITNTGTFSLSPSGVTPNTYGNASSYPVITVDNMGRITSASTQTVSSGNIVTVTAPELNSSIINNTVTISANSSAALWNANKLQSAPLQISSPANGQVLQYNFGNWINANTTGGTVTSFSTGVGLLGGPISTFGTIYADTTSAIWNANKIQSIPVNSATPNLGDVLRYNGTQWMSVPMPPPNSFWLNNGNTGNPGDFLGTNNFFPLIFKANGNEAMRIEPGSGFVGINTGTNTAVSRLDVAGNARFGGSKIFLGGVNGIDDGYTGVYEQSGDLNLAVFNPAGGGSLGIKSMDAVIIKSFSGYVGIGNASPQAPLDVPGRIRTDTLVITNNAFTGYVLTTDASGNGTWQSPTGSAGVNSVTVNSPLVNAGPVASPTISINQANATTDGFLSKTDWTTFNNKISNVNTAGTALTSTTTANSTTITANNSSALWNANAIQGQSVSATAPAPNQVLQFNGINWAPANANAGTVTSITAGNGLTGGTISSTGTISLSAPVTLANGGTNNTTPYTSGSVMFYDGTKIAENNSKFFWDNVNGRLGIGTTAPTNKVHIVGATNTDILNISDGTASAAVYVNNGFATAPVQFGSLTNHGIGFFTNNGVGAPAMVINTTGNVGIGTSSPNASAMLDVASAAKGMLIPRLSLTQTSSAAPVTSPATSLLVYNTAAVNDVTPGFYFWDGTIWQRFSAGSSATGPWSTLGNAGTVDGTNFIGTTDNVPFNIRVNNQKAGRIDQALANTFFGFQAGNIATGGNNAFVGYQAGFSNTSGFQNSANGTVALKNNTTGADNTASGYEALYSNTTGNSNTAAGSQSLYANTTGVGNTASGFFALKSNIAGAYNTAFGASALQNNSYGQQNIAIGNNALATQNYANSNTVWASDNVAVGYQALFTNNPTTNTNGYQNTAVGSQALYSNTVGSYNTAQGFWALYKNTSGDNNTAFGYQSLYNNTTGTGNTGTGRFTLYSNTTGFANTVSGRDALYNNTIGNQNIANGYSSLFSNVAGSGATVIGYNAMYYANNTSTAYTNYNVAIGFESIRGSTTASANTGNYNTAVGYQTLWSNTSGQDNTALGLKSLYANSTGIDNVAEGNYSLNSNTTGNNNTAVGFNALTLNTVGNYNTAHGYYTLFSNVAGSGATAIGYNAMYYANNTATAFTNYNVAVGYEALRGSTTASANIGNYNTALGYQTLWSTTGGGFNTATGYIALYANTTGNYNTSNGYQSLDNNTTGNNNTGFGTQALMSNTTGSNNTAVGYGANVASSALTNATAIGANAIAGASNALVLGGTGANAVNVGIGTTTPNVSQALHVKGSTTDVARIESSSSPSLLVFTDNSTTSSPRIGSTGNDFEISTNSLERLRVTVAGNVGIGTNLPSTPLHVNSSSAGAVKITDGTQGSGKILTSDAAGVGTWQSPVSANSGFSVFSTVNQSITSGGDVVITFNSKDFDPSNQFNTATGAFTAATAGVYQFSTNITWNIFSAASAGYTSLDIYRSTDGGATWSMIKQNLRQAPISGTYQSNECSFLLSLSAGNMIRVEAYQSSGVSQTTLGGSTTIYFSGFKVY